VLFVLKIEGIFGGKKIVIGSFLV